MGRINLSDDAIGKLAEVVCTDIHTNIVKGVTYILLEEKPNTKVRLDMYMGLRREIDSEGFKPDEVFRVYKVSNGYVFDMEPEIAVSITKAIMQKSGSLDDKNMRAVLNSVTERSKVRREKELKRLAALCYKAYKAGKTSLEVLLFGRNEVGKVIITVKDGKDDYVITYPSFMLRPSDMQSVNEEYLIKSGIRIKSIETGEIVGTNRGLRVVVNLGANVKKVL